MEDIKFGLKDKKRDIHFSLDGKPSKTKVKDSTPVGLFIDPKKVCSDSNAKVC